MTDLVMSNTYTLVSSGCCGGVFAVDEAYYKHQMTDKQRSWWCPYCGQCRVFTGETEVAKLKRRLEYMEARKADVEQQLEVKRKTNIALRGVVTRQKRRQAAGTCACCKRHFQNVARHMKDRHPEFVKESRTR